MAGVREEAVARNVRDVARQALLCHLVGVDVLRQLDPGEQAAVGVGELRLRRELALHGRHHDVTALAVALLDGGNVLVEVEHVDELGDNELRLGGSLQRRGLREEVVLLEDLAVGADPAQTVAGRQDLGEGAQEDNEALGLSLIHI